MRRTEKKLRRFTISQGGCHRWFSEILRESARGSFFTLWGQLGGLVFLCPYSRRKTGGFRRGYVQESAKIKVETPESKNAEQQVAAQHNVKAKIVSSSAFPSAAAQSSAQKSQPTDP